MSIINLGWFSTSCVQGRTGGGQERVGNVTFRCRDFSCSPVSLWDSDSTKYTDRDMVASYGIGRIDQPRPHCKLYEIYPELMCTK